MIRIEKLTKRFGTTLAVDSLDLEIHPGEVFGFLGPNGAGKTTTIRMMVGLLRPTSGTVRYENSTTSLDVRTEALAVRRQIGYIPDAPFLYEKLTGREHLQFVGEIYQVEADELEREINGFLDLFHLQEVADQPIEGYSHGMRQKIVMASSLLHHPRFLVVDEPMVGLDPRSARLVKDLLTNLAKDQGATLFLSTHSLDVAEEVCDRVGIISNGRLIAVGPPGELAQKQGGAAARLEKVFLELTEEEGG